MKVSKNINLANIGGLTENQARLLAYLRARISANGFTPSFREMGEGTNLGIGSVARIIEQLEQRGMVERHKGARRSIAVTPAGQAARFPDHIFRRGTL